MSFSFFISSKTHSFAINPCIFCSFGQKIFNMETTIRISPKELTPEWLKKIKALFENENELQITIKPMKNNESLVYESREEYVTRVGRAIENLESGKDLVSLSPSDFEKLSDELLARK